MATSEVPSSLEVRISWNYFRSGILLSKISVTRKLLQSAATAVALLQLIFTFSFVAAMYLLNTIPNCSRYLIFRIAAVILHKYAMLYSQPWRLEVNEDPMAADSIYSVSISFSVNLCLVVSLISFFPFSSFLSSSTRNKQYGVQVMIILFLFLHLLIKIA